MLPDHKHHAPAHVWLLQAKQGKFEYVVSGHSLAEVYSVLTRLPRTPAIDEPEAWAMLKDNVTSYARIVTLNGDAYTSLIEELSKQGIIGGLVYDAIIAKAAELDQVDQLVTLNDSDFRKVWPGGAGKIVSPVSTPPPVP